MLFWRGHFLDKLNNEDNTTILHSFEAHYVLYGDLWTIRYISNILMED
jgi:hypothetical protein